MDKYVYVAYYNKWDVVCGYWTTTIDRIFYNKEDALKYVRRFNLRKRSHGMYRPFKTIGKRTLY